MKHLTLFTLTLLTVLMLSACTVPASISTLIGGSATTETGTAPAAGFNGEAPTLSERAKLAMGIQQLETTEYPLTTEQVESLLFLWKAMNALDSNSATIQQENDALVAQIAATLTVEQRQAIDGMDLTMRPGGMQDGTTGTRGDAPAGGFGGGIPGGGAPGAGGGFPGGGVPGAGGPPQGTTGTDAEGTTRRAGGMESFATQAVIAYLEGLTGEGNN